MACFLKELAQTSKNSYFNKFFRNRESERLFMLWVAMSGEMSIVAFIVENRFGNLFWP